jgi:hypothetical protein
MWAGSRSGKLDRISGGATLSRRLFWLKHPFFLFPTRSFRYR